MVWSADLFRRRIKEAKRKTPRGSRAGSPAVTVTGQGATGTNPFQSFQPPPSANTFSFSLPGAPVPSFSKPVPQQNGSMSAANQPNGALSFGGFGNTQVNGAPSFGSNNAQPQTNGFTSFNFGTQTQPNTASTPSTSFSFGQSATTSQEQPKQNGFNPSTTSVFGARDGVQAQQPQINGETPKPNSFAGVFGNVPQTNGAAPAIGTGMFGSIPASSVTAAPAQGIFSGLNAASASTVRPGMFSDWRAVSGSDPAASHPIRAATTNERGGTNFAEWRAVQGAPATHLQFRPEFPAQYSRVIEHEQHVWRAKHVKRARGREAGDEVQLQPAATD